MSWDAAVDAAAKAAAGMTGKTARQVMAPPARGRSLPPARLAAMLALDELGMGPTAMGAAFGVDTSNASRVVTRARSGRQSPVMAAIVTAAVNAARPLVPDTRPPKQQEWTPKEDARLAEMRDAGAGWDEIAAALGRSRASVKMHAKRLAHAKPRKPQENAWTEADEARLVEMRDAGAGYDEIAAALGRTERACRNRATVLRKRGGQIARPKPQTSWKPWEDEIIRRGRAAGESFSALECRLPGRTKNMIISRAQRIELAPQARPAPASPAPARRPPPVCRPVSATRTCQWIEGHVPDCLDEDGNAPFCGQPALEGSSYCPAHHARCYGRKPGPGGETQLQHRSATAWA